MTSQSDYWTYATPTPQSSTGPPQPRARQPLGPASLVLIPTPTRSQAYAMNTSPLFHHRSNDEMTPLIHRNASAKPGHSPSPTPPSMTTQPSPSPHTPSTASSGASVPIKLAGIQPPAPFIGPYPVAYLNKDPVPSDHNDAGDNDASDLRRSSRQGAASCNPWDYVMTDETSKDGEESKGKVRRRFTKRELEALEVLWSISKSPTKYQRQRLGAWLGVKTKHITVWFQNRRQEEKRHSREGGSQTQTSSRSNRGTYDPVTGKWRPVPLSCISSLQPPPAEKLAAIQAISLGQITREIYLDQFPLEQSSPPRASNTVQRRPLTRTTSSSLDEVLQARESGFGESNRIYRRSGEIGLRGEGEERNRDMLALMPSDPPSMDLMELADEDELIEDEDKEDEEYAEPREPREKPNSCVRLGRPPPLFRAVSTDYLGRATSLDILASSSRAKQLISPGPPRAVSGPAGPLDAPRMVEKRSLTPISMHDSAKRAKFERQGSHSAYPESYSRPRDSFSRSQSAAILAAPPTPQTRTPGLTRSYSFSSTSSTLTPISEGSYHRNLDSHTGKTVYSRDMTSDSHGKRGREETDSEVLDAAKQLLNMLGGS